MEWMHGLFFTAPSPDNLYDPQEIATQCTETIRKTLSDKQAAIDELVGCLKIYRTHTIDEQGFADADKLADKLIEKHGK